MAQTYQTRRRAKTAPVPQTSRRSKGPSLEQLQGGAMPTREQLGHRVDLPEAIRSKMETSFGMDFSAVELYESPVVGQAGAEAVAMGSRIGFAPGALDFTSSGGQALLGHELSHVASQARGEVSGSGFLQNQSLEARADREGALAAAGESAYSGPVTPISMGSTALSAAGPMQAKKPGKKEKGAQEMNPIQKFSGEKKLDKRPEEFEQYHQAQLGKSTEWREELSPEEAEAIHTYSTGVYKQINGKLRGQDVTPPLGVDLDETTANISSAIHKTKLEEDTILHRGAGDGFIRFLLKNQMGIGKEELQKLGIRKDSIDELSEKELRKVMMAKATRNATSSQVFSDPAFTSTSIDRAVATDFATNHGEFKNHGHLMEIHAPKGTPAAYIELLSAYKHEKEMLLDKGQRWQLRAVESMAGEKMPSLFPGQKAKKFDKNSMRLILELINEEEEGQRR